MGLPDIDNIPDNGAVFTIGRSRFADNFASHFFIRQDPVVTIVCGDEHSAVVCQSGRLFVFGSNDWGQLGLGHKNHVTKPSCVKILKPEKVTNVACGRAHTLICTGAQKIFACGSDQEGQLGRGGLAAGDSSSSPVLVYDCGLAGPKILEVAAGSHHSMVLLSDGGVIAWGSNLEGQLGLPGTSGLVNKPTKVPIPEPVRAISAGYYHTAFLTESGLIYVCGEAESGKLGIVVNFSTQAAPKQLQLPASAVKIACGGHHSIVLTETGDLYCFGSNVSGQLGMGVDVTEVQTPKLLPRGDSQEEVITQIAAGESHTAVVTESGKLFMCGDGRHGKLGLEENENNVHELTHAIKYEELLITDVSCGGCHTILLGRRREGVNGEAANDSAARKNSLPPLKIPALGRIPGDILPDKSILDNAIKSVENTITETRDNAKEKLTDAKLKLQSNVEGIVKNVSETVKEDVDVVKQTAEGMIGNVKDAMNSIKIPEFPKKLADYIEEGNKTEELLNELANETEETTNNEKTNQNEFEETNKIAESLNRKESVASLKSTNSVQSIRSSDSNRKSSVSSNLVTQKQETLINEHQIPPPKPPRQKSGLLSNATTGEKSGSASSKSRVSDSVKSADKTSRENEKNKNPFEDNDEINEANETAKNCAAQSQDSKTTHSMNEDSNIGDTERKIRGEEDVLKTEESGKAQEKAETEMAQDDADVIHSPPPRTGKMAKLFKGKKPQEIQNGVKGSSASNSKVKSRTCTLL